MKRIYLHGAKNEIARHSTIRDINKQIVLNYVRDRSPISRAEIARETALQRSTVSAIVDDLQIHNLIEEIGTGDSTGGRKPTLLKLKTDIPVAIGVDITPRETTIASSDLAGRILWKKKFPTTSDSAQMSKRITSTIEKYISENPGHQLEVGITIPGVADQTNGNVLYVPYFKWRNWDISSQITKKTNLRVTVDNDANSTALAELWFGEERSRKNHNFITVLVAEGVGTGIIFDGQVYRGEQGAAGEFGHMFVGENAPVPCSCGGYNCWEAFASEGAMMHRYEEKFKKHASKDSPLTIEELITLAKNGDELAIEVFRETARYIGIGISNLIVGFSPQSVVVSGRIVRVWDLIKDEIHGLSERSVLQGLPETKIQASSLGDSPTLIGSLSLVLAKKFASAS